MPPFLGKRVADPSRSGHGLQSHGRGVFVWTAAPYSARDPAALRGRSPQCAPSGLFRYGSQRPFRRGWISCPLQAHLFTTRGIYRAIARVLRRGAQWFLLVPPAGPQPSRGLQHAARPQAKTLAAQGFERLPTSKPSRQEHAYTGISIARDIHSGAPLRPAPDSPGGSRSSFRRKSPRIPQAVAKVTGQRPHLTSCEFTSGELPNTPENLDRRRNRRCLPAAPRRWGEELHGAVEASPSAPVSGTHSPDQGEAASSLPPQGQPQALQGCT